MPANKRRVAVTAPYDRWVLLGKLLESRRRYLGYTYRTPGFERDRRVNRRLAADLETAAKDRVDHFTEGSLRLAAHGYQVTYGSMIAVLEDKADVLTPDPIASPAGPPDMSPPMPPAQAASDRPFFDVINERRVALALRGVHAPTGAQMFGDGTDDAQAWDGIGARLDIGARVWFIADLRRRAADRNGTSGAAGAGMLRRSYVAACDGCGGCA